MELNIHARVRKSQRLVPDPCHLSPYSNLRSVIFLKYRVLKRVFGPKRDEVTGE